MKMSTSSETLSQLEELLSVEHKESTLPKTLSNKELGDLLEAIDLYFLMNYDVMSFYEKGTQDEIKLFLDLRSEVLSKYKGPVQA
jgi:hypothetical protein